MLNDRLQFDTIASIGPNGAEAQVRGIELGLVGDAPKQQAHWEVNIYSNRFVKENGIWRVREMRVFPMFRSEYGQGWGKSRLGQPDGAAPDCAGGEQACPVDCLGDYVCLDDPGPQGMECPPVCRGAGEDIIDEALPRIGDWRIRLRGGVHAHGALR